MLYTLASTSIAAIVSAKPVTIVLFPITLWSIVDIIIPGVFILAYFSLLINVTTAEILRTNLNKICYTLLLDNYELYLSNHMQ